MISKITYVSSNTENNQYKEIIRLIKEQEDKHQDQKLFISSASYYRLLIYMKYIIESRNLDYSKIIAGDIDELFNIIKEKEKIQIFSRTIDQFKKYKLYDLFRYIAYRDFEITAYQDRVLDTFIDSNKKYLLITTLSIPYINHPNVDIFYSYMKSNLLKNNSMDIRAYEIYDEIIGIERKIYTDWNSINEKYDAVIFLNNSKLRFVDYNALRRECNQMIPRNIFMICNYSSISKYTNSVVSSLDLHRIKSISIDKDKAYINYVSSVREKTDYNFINIKNLTNILDDELEEVFNSEEEIEDVSINVTMKDIVDNRFRLGFTTYNEKMDITKKDILELVDKNEKIVERIKKLDVEIQRQIDKMIVK